MREMKTKRRVLIVPHKSHKRLITGIGAILLVLVLISGVSFYLLAEKRLADEYFTAHSQIRTTMQMLLPWLAGVYILGMMATILITTIYSRRLSGPMVRFEKVLDNLIKGDYTTRIALRKNDEFRELAVKINELSIVTCERFQTICSTSERLGRMEERMRSLSAHEISAEREALAKEVGDTRQLLNTLLKEIRF